jgi:hypothetical protein
MDLAPAGRGDRVGNVTLAALVIALIALATAGLAIRRAGVVERRAKAWVPVGPGRPQAPSAVSAGGLSGNLVNGTEHATGLSRVAVVRYDAFKDVGGELSYSVALVDNQGQGLMLTTINGRSETRTYVKELPMAEGAAGPQKLSPEESEALRKALQ